MGVFDTELTSIVKEVNVNFFRIYSFDTYIDIFEAFKDTVKAGALLLF